MKTEKCFKKKVELQTLWQCSVGVLFMAVVLFTLGHVAKDTSGVWAIGAGSLTASTYMIFVTPHYPSSQFFQLFFSYLACIIIGLAARSILIHFHTFFWFNVITAIVVGFAIFVMVQLRLKHSCAAGISVMLVLELRDYYPVLVILVSVLLLGGIHKVLKSKMKNLV